MFIVETRPLGEILHVAIRSFAVRNDAFHGAKGLQVFLLALLGQMKSFDVFLRESRNG
jgi:hypothetical protein